MTALVYLHWALSLSSSGSARGQGDRFVFVGGCAHGEHYELPPGTPHWQVPRRRESFFTGGTSPRLLDVDTYRRERLWADFEHPCVRDAVLRRGWEVFSCLPYREDGWVLPDVLLLVAQEPPAYEARR